MCETETKLKRGVKAGTKRGSYKKEPTEGYILFRDKFLPIALRQATHFCGVLRTSEFMGGKQIRTKFGPSAYALFKEWFATKKIYDDTRAERIHIAYKLGKMTQVQYEKRLGICFTSIWYLHEHRHKEAFLKARANEL